MRKTLLLSTLIAAALSVNAQQFVAQQVQHTPTVQKAPTSTGLMEYGYCSDEMVRKLGMQGHYTHRMLIEIPAEKAAEFEGAQIEKVRFGLGSLSDKNTKVIIMNSLDDATPVYSQDLKAKTDTWNDVTLTTPYTIGKDGFYIGYEIKAITTDYPIALDAGPASPYGDIVGFDKGEGFQYMHVGEQGFGNVAIKIYLSGDNLPKYDLALKGLSGHEVSKTGAAYTLSGTVKNMATQTVNSFDVTYQVDGRAPVTKTINTAVSAAQTATFDITGIQFDQAGAHNVTVTLSNLDGNSDEDASNNTLTTTVTALDELLPRKVLLENFSTASCNNCPAAHTRISNAIGNRDDVAWVVHHAGFITDDMTITESEEYCWFYASKNTYAPAMMLDRRNLNDQGSDSDTYTPVFDPPSSNKIKELVDYCIAQPAIVDVNMKSTYNETTREFNIQVDGQFVVTPSRETYLHIFLTESGMVGQQSGGGSEYVHDHAIRYVMTSLWGDEIELFDNGHYMESYSCTLDEAWNPEKMQVVAFISYNSNTDANACQVLNTNYKDLNDSDSAVKGVDNDNIDVWSAGKTICIGGAYNKAAVYSVDGRLVATANNSATIKVENNGIYIVVIDSTSHKVAVK